MARDETSAPRQGWRVLSFSVAGSSHRRRGLGCQDAVRTAVFAGRILCVALSDGAGSARQGARGSELATMAALRALARHAAGPAREDPEAARGAVRQALAEARERLAREAAADGLELRDLAATLLVGYAGDFGLAAGQVGDGALVFAAEGQALRALTWPAAGEYANETLFLTSEEALEKAQIEAASAPVRALAAFSDGLQRVALDFRERRPHLPFFHPLWRRLERAAEPARCAEEVEAWLRSPRLAERTDDDLSLCLAVRAGSEEGPGEAAR